MNDLKQFIAATVSQATSDLANKEDLQQVSQSLSKKIDDLELKVKTISEALNENLSDHATRLTRLEQQTT